MSEQVLVQFGVDKELKQEVSEIYEELGMDLPTALRMFMKKSKQVRGLPFDALRNEAKGIDDMSLDEINAEIKASRDT